MNQAENDEIMHNLEMGKVLPIFHTLCRPPNERLFRPNARVGNFYAIQRTTAPETMRECNEKEVDDVQYDVIQLSEASVTRGVCTRDADNLYKAVISLEDEKTYIPAFFNTNNTGYFCVQDVEKRWTFSEDYTNYITELVNEPSKMAGEDIEVTNIVSPLKVDDSSSNNLITQSLSRGVVMDCFAKSGILELENHGL